MFRFQGHETAANRVGAQILVRRRSHKAPRPSCTALPAVIGSRKRNRQIEIAFSGVSSARRRCLPGGSGKDSKPLQNRGTSFADSGPAKAQAGTANASALLEIPGNDDPSRKFLQIFRRTHFVSRIPSMLRTWFGPAAVRPTFGSLGNRLNGSAPEYATRSATVRFSPRFSKV